MSGARHVVVRARPGVSPEEARDIRARALAFVFDCYEKNKAAGVTSTDGDDAKGRFVDDFRTDEASLPR